MQMQRDFSPLCVWTKPKLWTVWLWMERYNPDGALCGSPLPLHQASKCATNTYNRKKTSWNVYLSLTHTHNTYNLTSSAILLYVNSMYNEYCCSVDSFVAKVLFSFDTFVFFKCINLFILFGWICLSFIRFISLCWSIMSKNLRESGAANIWVAPPLTDVISLQTFESPVWRMNAVSDAGNHTRSVNLSLIILYYTSYLLLIQ